jgi:hypothetical protein
MEKHPQVVQLCLPWLAPKDVCMLQCTCKELKATPLTWEAHDHIRFDLNGSPSAISWLHKNIVSIRHLSLALTFNPPKQLLQDLFVDGR